MSGADAEFLGGKVKLKVGNSRERIREIPDGTLDAVVTDPPYALVSIVKRFGAEGAAPAAGDVYARASAGFMGQKWDTGEVAFDPAFWADVRRAMKPGAHLVAFSGTRSYHRLAAAIEDAGFEIRDQLAWLYGSGFPKSHDVSKGIDKAAGATREVVGVAGRSKPGSGDIATTGMSGGEYYSTAPATPEAEAWQGWGTALKPAWEPIVLARNPLSGTVAANVLAHGTGAINIGGCRVGAEGGTRKERDQDKAATTSVGGYLNAKASAPIDGLGRWPANITHDGSDEVVGMFPYDGEQSAARFFYSAKADADDRIGSKHPTVKPVDLMQYFCRLITPPGGLILDPFAGSGTTGEAAWREGFDAILIEREEAFQGDIARRMQMADQGPGTRKRAIAKAKAKVEPLPDDGLFGFIQANNQQEKESDHGC